MPLDVEENKACLSAVFLSGLAYKNRPFEAAPRVADGRPNRSKYFQSVDDAAGNILLGRGTPLRRIGAQNTLRTPTIFPVRLQPVIYNTSF